MAYPFLPPINIEELPITNQIRYTFDIGPYVKEAVESIHIEIERHIEAEVVKILRERGYYILDQHNRLGEISERKV